MRPILGEELWALFVLHANNHYKERFLAAFDHDVLACVGRRDGTPCTKGFAVCLRSASAYDLLEELHYPRPQTARCDMLQQQSRLGEFYVKAFDYCIGGTARLLHSPTHTSQARRAQR